MYSAQRRARLEWISRRYAATRDQSLAALSAQLERFAENDPTLNGFLVSYLLDLKAVEAAPLIERAFASDQIDLSVMGDWEDAQVGLGLKAKREQPRRKDKWWPDIPALSAPMKKRRSDRDHALFLPESVVEDSTLDWFAELGYTITHGA
jgi:hypothetical protein